MYQLWVRDTAGIEFNGEWHLWNTYDEIGNAEYIEFLFNQHGYETQIMRVNRHGHGPLMFWFLR